MKTFIKLYSSKNGEIERFLEKFYEKKEASASLLEWQQNFENPVEMANMIGVFIDNSDNYKINMWLCLDENVLINVTKNNANDLIRYLYERYPY